MEESVHSAVVHSALELACVGCISAKVSDWRGQKEFCTYFSSRVVLLTFLWLKTSNLSIFDWFSVLRWSNSRSFVFVTGASGLVHGDGLTSLFVR